MSGTNDAGRRRVIALAEGGRQQQLCRVEGNMEVEARTDPLVTGRETPSVDRGREITIPPPSSAPFRRQMKTDGRHHFRIGRELHTGNGRRISIPAGVPGVSGSDGGLRQRLASGTGTPVPHAQDPQRPNSGFLARRNWRNVERDRENQRNAAARLACGDRMGVRDEATRRSWGGGCGGSSSMTRHRKEADTHGGRVFEPLRIHVAVRDEL